MPVSRGRAELSEVLGTGLFDLERAHQAPGWVRELNGDHVPETEEYGISSTVFRSDLPFHSERLWTFVTDKLGAAGTGRFCAPRASSGRPAGRPHVTGLWSQAGSVARFEPSGARDAGTTQGQELVFIGTALRAEILHEELSACLMSVGEARPAADPFPDWDTYGIGDACEHVHLDTVAAHP
ncbi:GTP-binding protein [Streptomyces sp. NBC_00236]